MVVRITRKGHLEGEENARQATVGEEVEEGMALMLKQPMREQEVGAAVQVYHLPNREKVGKNIVKKVVKTATGVEAKAENGTLVDPVGNGVEKVVAGVRNHQNDKLAGAEVAAGLVAFKVSNNLREGRLFEVTFEIL